MNELKNEVHEVEQRTKYLVMIGFALICFGFAWYFTPSFGDLIEGLKRICLHHSLANSDFLAVAGEGYFGAAFVNCGLLILATLATYYVTDTKIMGVHFAATGIVAAYSFYTKNIFNVWPVIIGVFLYAKVMKRPLKDYSGTAWFASVLGIIVSTTAFSTPALQVGTMTSIMLGVLFGILVGFFAAMICLYTKTLHRGYTVFNLGFATGIVITFFYSIYQVIGWKHNSYSNGVFVGVTTKSYNVEMGIFCAILFVYFIVCGLIIEKNKKNIKPLITGGFKGGDYDAQFGFGAALINSGLCGFISLLYALATGWIAGSVPGGTFIAAGQLSGPAIAGIITVGTWGTFGVTPKTYATLLAGVYAVSVIGGGITGAQVGTSFLVAGTKHAASMGMLVVSGFVIGLCPIPGDLGIVAGFVAACMHTVMAQCTGAWHGWMTSYNNGFAGGLVATCTIPLLMVISKKRRHEKLY